MGNSSNPKKNNKKKLEYSINQSILTPINSKNLFNSISQRIVVGIDFGTAGIGFAYSLYNDKQNIILSDLKNQIDSKVPSEIILDNDLNKVLAFGNECSLFVYKF